MQDGANAAGGQDSNLSFQLSTEVEVLDTRD